eukprot:Nk52_evm7s302 gene=Nk52_evmTU7s302
MAIAKTCLERKVKAWLGACSCGRKNLRTALQLFLFISAVAALVLLDDREQKPWDFNSQFTRVSMVSRESLKKKILAEEGVHENFMYYPQDARINTRISLNRESSRPSGIFVDIFGGGNVNGAEGFFYSFAMEQPVEKQFAERGAVVFAQNERELAIVVAVWEHQRNALKSTLPVHVYYSGKFPNAISERLRALGSVSLEEITDTPVGAADSSNVRVFVMLLQSPFRQTLVIDASFWAVNFRLDELFANRNFKATGALFFRSLLSASPDVPSMSPRFQRHFIQQFIGGECKGDDQFCQFSNILSGGSPSDQYPGIFLLNTDWSRHQTLSFFTFLVLNHHPNSVAQKSLSHWCNIARDGIWITRETSDLPYYFVPETPAMIGNVEGAADAKECLAKSQTLVMYDKQIVGFATGDMELSLVLKSYNHWSPSVFGYTFVPDSLFETSVCKTDSSGRPILHPLEGAQQKSLQEVVANAIEVEQTIAI